MVTHPKARKIVPPSPTAQEKVLSILAILDVQFYSLNKSQVHPSSVGLSIDSNLQENSKIDESEKEDKVRVPLAVSAVRKTYIF